MSCKHGLSSEEVCSLCKGKRQEQPLGHGAPPWFTNSTQMAIRTNYGQCHGNFSETSAFGSTSMPRGSKEKEFKTSLPYKKYSNDNKTRNKRSREK